MPTHNKIPFIDENIFMTKALKIILKKLGTLIVKNKKIYKWNHY